MHYPVAIAWIIFIVYGLRSAYAEHIVAKGLLELRERLGQVEVGMSTKQVMVALGSPVRVVAAADSVKWQYRVAREFKNVTFTDGRVVECDPPPQQMAGELQGQDPSRS